MDLLMRAESLFSLYKPILLTLCLTFILKIIFVWFSAFRPKSQSNPFKNVVLRNTGPVEFEIEKRKKVLKEAFSINKVPENLDAIVIGSGIGGLSAAAILAKAGKKVLVLEKIGKAGGGCHIFGKKGFTYDVGIHYIGQMGNDSITRSLIDQLTDGNVQWERMDDNYETVMIGENNNLRTYPIYSGWDQYKKNLLEKFPNEEPAIDKYIKLVKTVNRSLTGLALIKVLPKWVCKLLIYSGLLKVFFPFFKYADRSVKSVLEEITNNKDLQLVFCYTLGDYGCLPKDGSFAMQCLITNHYMKGAFYPVGGPSQFPYYIIPVIEASGGKVFVNAQVSEILLDDEEGAVKGVRVTYGKNNDSVDLFAPIVISDAGVANTLERLLPTKIVNRSFCDLKNSLQDIGRSLSAMWLFVGLRGNTSELKLPKSQIWAYSDNNVDEAFGEYISADVLQATEKTPPLSFISFTSAKDPVAQKQNPETSVCTVIGFANYDWFKQWESEYCGKRSVDYNNLKNLLALKLWDRVLDFYPHLKDKVENFEVGTPLTASHYLTKFKGEIYGLSHSVKRFEPVHCMHLRPSTGISGFYLTGQDVMTCGFAGALYGGFLTASVILRRNLMKDLKAVHVNNKKQN